MSARGGCLPGGCLPRGGCLLEGVHPPRNRITDRSKNINFPQLQLWTVKISLHSFKLCEQCHFHAWSTTRS